MDFYRDFNQILGNFNNSSRVIPKEQHGLLLLIEG